MRALIVIVVLLAAAIGAWLTRDRWLPGPSPAADAVSATGTTAAGAPDTASTHTPQAPPAGRGNTEVREQAQRYVDTLTRPEQEPVRVERADHFVTGDQMLTLVPHAAIETTTVQQMRVDPTLAPDTPITVVREVEQVERVTPEKLIARSAGELDARVKILVNDEVQETTVRQVLESASRTPDAPIDLVTLSEYYEQTTLRELAERADEPKDTPIRIIRKHRGLETSSVADLMRSAAVAEDSLFYVRTVRPEDSQGIWGIVHDGIVDNFARGMAIRRGREVSTYQVEIPRDADERLADTSSSFLGKLIFKKSAASHVYNFTQNRMGKNPDRIVPGQEIVIINFRAEELIEIYRHFVEQRG